MPQLIYGIHPVVNAIKRGRARCLILAKHSNLPQLTASAKQSKIPVEYWEKAQFTKQFPSETHQFCAAQCADLHIYDENYLKDIGKKNNLASTNAGDNKAGYKEVYLALDGITDPHNMGACIRNAVAFSCSGIIFPKNNSAPISATCVKSSAGMAEWVKLIRVTNLTRSIQIMQDNGFWVVAADAAAKTSIDKLKCDMPIVLLMGSEGKGIRPLPIKHSDFVCRINTSSQTESLNVASACAVMLNSIRVQQNYSADK